MDTTLINHMGTDLTVVNAARVSFNKESDWENVTPAGRLVGVLKEGDEKLIKYLAKHNHFTPFTHCTITMREDVPIFVARQRFKHTVGFSYNEISRRYVASPPDFYTPKGWRKAAENAKQGSSDEVVDINYEFSFESDEGKYKNPYDRALKICEQTYYQLINMDVCPEQARMVLPQSMYTSYYVTGSLYAWARAYNLRSDPHAQQEIQELAEGWNKILKHLYSISWEALTE